MAIVSRLTPLALALLFAFGHARAQSTAAIGLEVPAPAPPREGHLLTGAYVSGNYSPVLMPGGPGYAVQPYLRYVLGREGRARPYVQYNFAAYGVQAYGSAAPWGTPGSEGSSANPAFAPLPMRGAVAGQHGYSGYGGLGGLSVGIPVQIARTPLMLNVGGNVLQMLTGGTLR